MLKVKSSSVLDDATAVGAPTTTRSKLGLVALATAGAITLGAPGAYATTIDPLHGQCNGTGGTTCQDAGLGGVTPLGNSTQFNFTISPGPQTGLLQLEVLIPTNEFVSAPGSITQVGDGSFTGTKVSGTWTSGDLATFLGINASPSNPISAFLAGTNSPGLDPTATAYDVFTYTIGTRTISDNSAGNTGTPQFDVIGLPLGSEITAFCTTQDGGATFNGDCSANGGNTPTIATAPSGVLLVDATTPPTVPEPASLVLLGSAVAGLGLFGRRRRKT
jgi:hypothetical protein